MRRLVAATIVALFASLNAIDGICCPDGCTHEQPSTSQRDHRDSSDNACVLCVGGIESAPPALPFRSGLVSIRIAPTLYAHHLDAPADPPDHPPRG